MEEALGHPSMDELGCVGNPFIDSKYVTLGHPLTDEIGYSWASIRDEIFHFGTSIIGWDRSFGTSTNG
jgi:hypothetical protein